MPAGLLASLVLALSVAAMPASAATASAATAGAAPALKGTPFASFTEDDTALFMNTARVLVTSKADGEKLRWANDASGAWGTMTVKSTYKRRGATCRDVRGDNTAKGRTDAFRVVLCRRAQDDWRVASSGPAPRRR